LYISQHSFATLLYRFAAVFRGKRNVSFTEMLILNTTDILFIINRNIDPSSLWLWLLSWQSTFTSSFSWGPKYHSGIGIKDLENGIDNNRAILTYIRFGHCNRWLARHLTILGATHRILRTLFPEFGTL
jgi:hypothetical protein